MFGIGVPELLIILVIGLIVFGPGKLPEIGRGLGKTIREFRKVSSGIMEDEPTAATSRQDVTNKAPESMEDKSSITVDSVEVTERLPDGEKKE